MALPFVLRARQGRGKAQRLAVDNLNWRADFAHIFSETHLLYFHRKYTEDTRELATRKSLLLKQLQVAILCFSSVYCGWREGLTIQEIIAEQRRRSVSANPAERLAAALLIPNLLRERLRSLPDCEIGELLEHEVCSNPSVLA